MFREHFRWERDREIDANDEIMVARYAQAVALARSSDLQQPAGALPRLAYLTDIIGNQKMGSYVRKALDLSDPSRVQLLEYTDGMYMLFSPLPAWMHTSGMTSSPPMPDPP